jgi:hypothetical protein
MTTLSRRARWTGRPPGLLQDDCRKLSKWLAGRLDARAVVRRVCSEIETQRRLYANQT